MAAITTIQDYLIVQPTTPDNPDWTLQRTVNATETELIVNFEPLAQGATITKPFLIGIESGGYVETMLVTNVNGTTLTVVRGIALAGLDFDGVAANGVIHRNGSNIFTNISAPLLDMLLQAGRGVISSSPKIALRLTYDDGGVLAVPVFADATARDAALTSPQEGDRCRVTAEGAQEYDGVGWVTFGVSTPITASTGTTKVGQDIQLDLSDTNVFASTSSGAGDSGKAAVLDASGKFASGFLRTRFGGDGSDGALDTSGGTVDIDLGAADVVIKNYTSINIATNNLTVSNAATTGTVLILKSQGDVTISSTLTLSGAGAAGGTGGAGVSTGSGTVNGNPGTAGQLGNNVFETDVNGSLGVGGTTIDGAGSASSGQSSDANNRTTNTVIRLIEKTTKVFCGSGGGGGGSGAAEPNDTSGAGGAGGAGAGGLIIECAGLLDFSGTIDISGADGSDGGIASGSSAAQGGAGGGGGAGVALVLYNALTANTGTIDASGGIGGDGGDTASGSFNSLSGGSAGGGAGSLAGAGGGGGGGKLLTGQNGTNGGTASGGGGGGGAGQNTYGAIAGGTGGTGGASSSLHYFIAENTEF